ncbi:MAG: protein translocase subunit SecD [Rhodobacteraceae bacterium]|nr:protein translocase subunit SecD [Paracoccaceae bacterium]
MLRFPLWKKLCIILVCCAGLVFAVPNLRYAQVEQYKDAQAAILAAAQTGAPVPDELRAQAGQWPGWMPSTLVNLGLDLRGGAHLLAEVKLEEVHAARIDGMWAGIRDALREERATIGTIRRHDGPENELRIRISQPGNIAAAVAVVRRLARPVATLTGVRATDIDVTGSGDMVIITLSEEERAATDRRTMQQSLEIIRRRVDEAGTREPTIQRQGADRILIQVPGIGSAEELKDLIGTTAKLTFHHVIGSTGDAGASLRSRQLLLPSQDQAGVFYILEKTPIVTGECLANAQAIFDQNNRPAVSFTFNGSCGRIMGEHTAGNIGNPMAIVLDGVVVSAPTIQGHITSNGQITGQFTLEETRRLAIQLRAGALPAGVEYLEERTIGPELGQDSIDAGRIACIVAFLAVLIFMFLSYGTFGIFANIALILNVGLMFGLLGSIGATLTLPGIAGIVLTIGMAVDANVLVFERIREELKLGRGPVRAIEVGYERAFSAIIDASITTLIAAIILFVIGSGPVRGFSITLGLGIITSVFTAIYVTRMIISIWVEYRRPRTIEV